MSCAGGTLDHAHRRAYQLLHDTCGDCSGEAADRLWRPILNAVSSLQRVVPIFTLNYDWIFEKLAIEQMKRYQLERFELLGGTWDADCFVNLKPAAGKTNVALFRLHGSTFHDARVSAQLAEAVNGNDRTQVLLVGAIRSAFQPPLSD